jgi:hypothetical protein
VDNRSKDPIVVRYHHEGYEEWSAPWKIPAGEAQSFAREHWVQEILEIRIQDGSRVVTLGAPEMESIQNSCSNSFVTRRLKLASDCFIVYSGNGRWSATSNSPSDINDRLNKSLWVDQSQSSSSS